MDTQYVSHKSTYFYSHPDWERMTLIYGDELQTDGIEDDGYKSVYYRGRDGWVKTDHLMDNHPLEMYHIDVGQGDSTFIVTPAGKTILIDGGQGNEAFQFLVWKYRLDLENPAPVDIDLMVVTHVDDDHLKGLISIVKNPWINVRRIVHSGIAKFNSPYNTMFGEMITLDGEKYLETRHDTIEDLKDEALKEPMDDWVAAIKAEPGIKYGAVDDSTGEIDLGDPSVKLTVLGPRLVKPDGHPTPVYPWLGSKPAVTVNGHSVVLRLDYKDIRILLTGDINDKGAQYLMTTDKFKQDVNAHVFKAPHHGSHEYDLDFLKAVQPQISIVSSGESPDHGHPRANFLGTVGKVSRSDEPLLFSTELVAFFEVDEDAAAPDADNDVNPNATHPSELGQARRRFKKRLNGIINVRTDGKTLYCARRVAASYQFVTYEQKPQPRDKKPGDE